MLRISCLSVAVICCLIVHSVAAEFAPQKHLDRPIIGPLLSVQELQSFCQLRLKPVPAFDRAEDWTTFADEVRQRTLDNVVFRGAAAQWRDAKTSVEWLDTIDGGDGYRIKKLRYEALPGLWIPALLYEPTQLDAKAPVFLNVNGHDRAGKAAGYKQLRCINLAKRGILALNLEWVGMGQLRADGYSHARLNQLDLCGTSGVAVHYLAMKRALDLILTHPNADATRVGVAGLSGGGWQTIFFSSLEKRVTLCNPVAGYSGFVTRSNYFSDLGDSEQTPVDLGANADYTMLTALLAPRAALLTFNVADKCCFAAGHALPPLLDAARPTYRLLGKENDLRWHVNHVPGSHNFEQDNREALYRVIGDTFFPGDAKYPRHEVASRDELKTGDQLNVPLPEVNADFHSLASKLAESLPQYAMIPQDATGLATWRKQTQSRLTTVVRPSVYRTVGQTDHVEQADGVDVIHWRLRVGDVWTVPAVEFAPPQPKSTVLLVADAGRNSAATQVQEQLKLGNRVVAVDILNWGESKPKSHGWLWMLMISTVGDRPLGVQASQLASLARWSQATHGNGPVSILGVGPKASLSTLIAAALDSQAIGRVETREGLASLKQVLTDNLIVSAQPEYFCFGLLEQFDIPQLEALVGRDRITRSDVSSAK